MENFGDLVIQDFLKQSYYQTKFESWGCKELMVFHIFRKQNSI